MEPIKIAYYESPVGTLILGSFYRKLCLCDWRDSILREHTDRRLRLHFNTDFKEEHSEISYIAATQLDEYFAGVRRSFTLPFVMVGSEFQLAVWAELLNIPYAATISYSWLSQCIGSPKAVRAVGMACGRNPLSVIVPCHRVVGSRGRLTGYAGGLEAKEYLLRLERTRSLTRKMELN